MTVWACAMPRYIFFIRVNMYMHTHTHCDPYASRMAGGLCALLASGSGASSGGKTKMQRVCHLVSGTEAPTRMI